MIDRRALEVFRALFAYSELLRLEWPCLEALTIPYSSDREVYQLFPQLKRLRKLEVTVPYSWYPNEPSPLALLNHASFETLTYLSFAPRFDFDHQRHDTILDPYQNLLCDGFIQGLTCLETLKLTIIFEGTWRRMTEERICIDEWAELDRVLAPRDVPRPLRTLHLLQLMVAFRRSYGYRGAIKYGDDDDDTRLVRMVQERVFDVHFPALKDLDDAGEIDFQLGFIH